MSISKSFRYQAESSGLHPDRSLCPYCGARKRMHAHSGGSVRINLSELTPAVPEAAGHSPVESDWLSDGPRVGARVLRRLKGHGHVHAVVQLYLPAGADDEPALWRIRHADGDEEDLEEYELLEALQRFATSQAEGLRLHLSSSSSTGYKGVRADRSRFKAQRRVGGRLLSIGTFNTAVEAAVAWARAVGEYQPPTVATEADGLRLHLSSSSNAGYRCVFQHASGRRSRFQAQHKVGGRVAVQYSDGALYPGEIVGFDGASSLYSVREAAPAAPLVTEAEGLQLHLSSSTSTGYSGVRADRSRFKAQRRVGGRMVYLGSFATAVEAAVAYARAGGEYQPPAPPTVATEAEGLRLHLSSSSSTGYKNVGKLPSGRYQAAPAAPLVTEAEGLQLHLSSSTSTGYSGVRADRSRFKAQRRAEGLRLHLSSSNATGYKGVYEHSGRFKAQRRVGGRLGSIGKFDTAVEAAVAYARAVGEYQPPAPPTVATEAEGLRLHLSSSGGTGYKGVARRPSGRFSAQHWVDGRLAEGLRLHLSGCTGSAGLAAGSPCWAKLRGSPWWPALISAEEGESVRVRFCGTGNVATLERASCIKSLREDERLFDATRWGKDFGRPKWKHLRAPFASAVAQALEVEAALPHAPPGALSRGPAGSSADNARRCDERPPKRRRTSAAQEAVQMVADLETADAELDAPPVRRCAVTLDRCLPSSANRGAAPPRLGIGDGWAAS
ncbi:hypothetical protein EMIHUDRAFT_448797 [Emiliania huxleyi CCMP1516]|uniref:PWWP domain-containing protein n=2 Tax=Emiliania huxleyi TaxID=2903 RepID=A0A0D3L098_EMIH1|nr:hypothetical protein EMIHUDRAFT_448797 [Emiliania huxleyi CCMP1516]EOD41433.1 hypothetical protein EMIHUDRAFT_448797 [Emiliania huxleyi CCMP1516]|eukprot:XP_005793862.1 hypothetical protein EMIHUDRAFT_448797 [Emiliania huxleyi CCMP1516]